MRRSRSRSIPLLTPLILVITSAIIITALIALKSITLPVASSNTERVEFVVNKGNSVTQIATNLYEAGLIRSPLGFRWVVKKEGLGSQLQAGNYYLSPSMSSNEVALSLTRGIADLKLTIPEGYRLEEVAATLEEVLDIPPAQFLSLSKNLEGYLFPDTYFVAPHSSAETILTLMQNNFTKKVGEIDRDTLILASLIERETRGNAEKPIVAGILTKRLSAGWPLELDATIQYALGSAKEWWPVTTLADRQAPSPYNTYLRQGLPPGPICNPGLASIQAAQNPQSSDYWFYLHGKDGTIRYAATLEEHNANIAKYIH